MINNLQMRFCDQDKLIETAKNSQEMPAKIRQDIALIRSFTLALTSFIFVAYLISQISRA